MIFIDFHLKQLPSFICFMFFLPSEPPNSSWDPWKKWGKSPPWPWPWPWGHAEVRLLRPPNPGLGRNLGEVPGPGAAGRLALPSRGATKNVGISPRKIHGMQGGITSSWKVGM